MTPQRTERAARVRTQVHDALTELRTIRCADHAATSAIHAIKLTERTLECWWLPLLDRAIDQAVDRDASR